METTFEQKKDKYKLYALEAGDAPSDVEFYFLMPDIDLVYTREKPEKAVEITDPRQLPFAAREWLLQVIADIAEKYLKDNERAALEGSRTFMERLDRELALEQQKQESGRSEDHG